VPVIHGRHKRAYLLALHKHYSLHCLVNSHSINCHTVARTPCLAAPGSTSDPFTGRGGVCLPRAQARAVLRRAFARETTSSPDMYAAAARNWGEAGRLRRVFAKLLRGTRRWVRLGRPLGAAREPCVHDSGAGRGRGAHSVGELGGLLAALRSSGQRSLLELCPFRDIMTWVIEQPRVTYMLPLCTGYRIFCKSCCPGNLCFKAETEAQLMCSRVRGAETNHGTTMRGRVPAELPERIAELLKRPDRCACGRRVGARGGGRRQRDHRHGRAAAAGRLPGADRGLAALAG